MIAELAKKHAEDKILPFWKRCRDERYGGYYGRMDYNLYVGKEVDKGVILHSRILWFFSNAYLTLKEEESLAYATHAYNFLKEYCYDGECGGVYWSVTYDGKVRDSTKHTYNQAFAIYALSSYYDATHCEEALQLAYEIVHIIEEKCRDQIGYMEAFTKDFVPIENDKLSENGLLASKTYNTLLHVFEAYTELYRVDHNPEIKKRMEAILDQFTQVLYNPERKMMEVFFDENMKTLSDLHSFGHDIETAWLIDRGLDVLNEESYTGKVSVITKALTECVYRVAFDGTSLNNEKFKGIVDHTKIWWVQAEAVVGFINGYQRDVGKQEYLEAANSIFHFIMEHFVDKREGSEWFYDLNPEGIPESKKEIVGPWKCPYHNGRMCFELINRKNQGLEVL